MSIAFNWNNLQTITSRNYVCGYCGQPLASEKGWFASDPRTGNPAAFIYICHQCKKPTFLDNDGKQTPGITFGNDVNDINDQSVQQLYDEARKCTGENAFTAAVLCCRKLLMHIAVSKGADEGKKFIEYVKYLSDKNFIPPDAKEWVDHIRDKGNEANHEIAIMTKDDATDLIAFIEMLLKLIYEFPANIKKKKNIA